MAEIRQATQCVFVGKAAFRHRDRRILSDYCSGPGRKREVVQREAGTENREDHVTRPDNKAAVTVLQGNGLSVELVWFADAVPLSKAAPQLEGNHEIHGIFKSGIFVDDLDATLSELKSRGVIIAFEPFYEKSMNCRMFAIRDNNGNILQFFGNSK